MATGNAVVGQQGETFTGGLIITGNPERPATQTAGTTGQAPADGARAMADRAHKRAERAEQRAARAQERAADRSHGSGSGSVVNIAGPGQNVAIQAGRVYGNVHISDFIDGQEVTPRPSEH